MSLPKQTKAWISSSTSGGLDSLEQTTLDLPELGPNDVLVKIHAATLNYRDIMLISGTYPFPAKSPGIRLSDASGEIIAAGSHVKLFKVGDKVASLFNQGHQHGKITIEAAATGLGGAVDGVATQYAVFPETGVVSVPKGYSYEEAATLPCAAVTAWNALYGLRPLKAGESVLIQGTGGVSLFGLQFAKAAGAFVIATTSSEEKSKLLKELGADVVINYKTTPEWGPVAKKASPGGAGVEHVIEIGGTGTIGQSYKAIKPEGIISLIGAGGVAKGGDPNDFNYMNALANICTLRGVFVGSKEQQEDMNRSIEANGIKPVLDKRVFKFDELKEAMQYQIDMKHIGKIVVKISE